MEPNRQALAFLLDPDSTGKVTLISCDLGEAHVRIPEKAGGEGILHFPQGKAQRLRQVAVRKEKVSGKAPGRVLPCPQFAPVEDLPRIGGSALDPRQGKDLGLPRPDERQAPRQRDLYFNDIRSQPPALKRLDKQAIDRLRQGGIMVLSRKKLCHGSGRREEGEALARRAHKGQVAPAPHEGGQRGAQARHAPAADEELGRDRGRPGDDVGVGNVQRLHDDARDEQARLDQQRLARRVERRLAAHGDGEPCVAPARRAVVRRRAKRPQVRGGDEHDRLRAELVGDLASAVEEAWEDAQRVALEKGLVRVRPLRPHLRVVFLAGEKRAEKNKKQKQCAPSACGIARARANAGNSATQKGKDELELKKRRIWSTKSAHSYVNGCIPHARQPKSAGAFPHALGLAVGGWQLLLRQGLWRHMQILSARGCDRRPPPAADGPACLFHAALRERLWQLRYDAIERAARGRAGLDLHAFERDECYTLSRSNRKRTVQ